MHRILPFSALRKGTPGSTRYCSNFNPISLVKSVVIYAHLLKLCSEQCKRVQSRKVFDEMPQRVSVALKACKIVHAQSLKFGFQSSGQLENAILDLYAKCGNMGYTQNLFNMVVNRDATAWNSLMLMYSRCGFFVEVVKSFGSMRSLVVVPNEFSYGIVLSACARLMLIGFGKQVHCDVFKTGCRCDSLIEGSLVDMYVKCNLVEDARQMFDQLQNSGLVPWTAMIAAYVQNGLVDEALKLFEGMREMGCFPDHVVYLMIIHALVSLGRLEEARNLFFQVALSNTVVWNIMISTHSKKGYHAQAISFFLNMRKAGVNPTRSTLGSVLSAIASIEAHDIGLPVHAQAIKQGLDHNVFVGSSLINMYAKCQKPKSAKDVFDSLEERNVVLWNAMLGGYAQNSFAREVVELFVTMRDNGVQADEFTYTSILSACGCLESLDMGSQLHCVIIKTNFESNLFVGNALADMYAKSGALTEARQVFECIQNPDNVSWNAIIVGYVQEAEEDKAFYMFRRMMLDGTVPDEVALASILNACSNIKDVDRGKMVHCLTVKYGLEASLYAGSSLIDVYVKGGDTEAASKIFHCMPQRSVVSVNALIAGCAHGHPEEAVNLFKAMQSEGLLPSEITYANLLDACDEPSCFNLGRQIHCLVLKQGLLYDVEFLGVALLGMYMNSLRKAEAVNLFLEFPSQKSTILRTSMISGLIKNECSEEALLVYREMLSNKIMPDQATFASVLKACSTLTSLKDGILIHSLIFCTGFNSDELVGSALMDMYAKCGAVKSSLQVFKEMTIRRDVISWNSVIVGLAKNGFAEDALMIFDDMMQSHVEPDDVTFLGVLTACSHAGRIYEGRQIYDIMVNHYRIQPRSDHCACMIDLFGRWGLLEEADCFINKLEFEPDAMIWASYLGACKLHGDEVRGARAAAKLIDLEPQNSVAYILLSSIYASSGNWKEVNSLRRQMREKGIKKVPGCSWIGETEDEHVYCIQ